MGFTVQLVDATPNRLRYFVLTDGQAEDPSITIPNDGGASPDLLTDVESARARAHGSAGPLREIINAGRDGIANIPAGGLTQQQAVALLQGNDLGGTILSSAAIPRCRLSVELDQIFPGPGAARNFAAFADVDGEGDPVITVVGDDTVQNACVVDLHFRHSYDL